MVLQKGSRGNAVTKLQHKLNRLGYNLVADGIFGSGTTRAVRVFQGNRGLIVDGIVGSATMNAIDVDLSKLKNGYQQLGQGRFAVFVDAGHGGLDKNGRYLTAGKRAYHEGLKLHSGGDYYEGLENRIIAESVIAALTDLGVQCIRTYHPYKDTPLSKRTELVRDWLDQGFSGYLHSFHSNAISSKNTQRKLESTQGFMCFSGLGNTFSDEIASRHYDNAQSLVPEWNYRKDMSDGDVDYEVNFQILRETDLARFPKFGAILEEWGFHTSRTDVQFIIASREQRIEAAVKTALWVRDHMNNGV